MKKLLVVFLVAALFVPGTIFAKATDADDSDDMDKPSPSLGREKIYLSEGLNQACFCKCGETKFQHDLYYSCFYCNTHKRTPGVCKCGAPLTPSFKHGTTWHSVSRDDGGFLIVQGMGGNQPQKMSGCPDCTPDAKCAYCAAKGAKKAKKSKKSKKSKRSKKSKKSKK